MWNVLAALAFLTSSAWFLGSRWRMKWLRRLRQIFVPYLERPDIVEEMKTQGIDRRQTIIFQCRTHFLASRFQAQKPDLLLLHGIGASCYTWRKLWPLLTHRFNVWVLDIRGFGYSDAPGQASYSLASQVDWIKQFLLQENLRRPFVVGSSMGGLYALTLALKYPAYVSQVATISPAYSPKVVQLDLRRFKVLIPICRRLFHPSWVNVFSRRIYSDSSLLDEDTALNYLWPYIADNHGDKIRAFVASIEGLMDPWCLDRLNTIQCPTLILWGHNDRMIPVRFLAPLRQLLLKAEFAEHAHAGHHLHEEDPVWVAEKLLDFWQPNLVT